MCFFCGTNVTVFLNLGSAFKHSVHFYWKVILKLKPPLVLEVGKEAEV